MVQRCKVRAKGRDLLPGTEAPVTAKAFMSGEPPLREKVLDPDWMHRLKLPKEISPYAGSSLKSLSRDFRPFVTKKVWGGVVRDCSW